MARAREFSGGQDIDTVRRLATDFMASYLLSSPATSQDRDGMAPPLVESASSAGDAAVAVELLGDVAMAVWVGFIDGRVVVQRVAVARRNGEWQVMAPLPH